MENGIIVSILSFDLASFLDLAGSNPFSAMLYLFLHGGWIVIVLVLLWGAKYIWLDYIQTKNMMQKEWVLLRIQVPRASEQTAKAAENIYATLAGAHTPISWREKWFMGNTQSPMSLEIASLEGNVAYYVRCERKMRDIVEASIYAQYPDAEIVEAEDYSRQVPGHYPDEEWDVWGTEMIPVKPDSYPLKTYPDFEDKISGEFKDPMAVMLENFSRLGPGEQAWYQIVITPTDQKAARKHAEKIVNKIKGIKEEHKKTVLDHMIDLPIKATQELAGQLLGGGAPAAHPKEEKNAFPRMLALSPGERNILEAIERKAAKIGFLSKIRFLYVAKKPVMTKTRAVHPFIGAIKQTNTFDMQALKPESKHVGVNGALWFFKDKRNNHRKSHLMSGYRNRSNWTGMPMFMLSSEELATLWHFPILLQVKAPSLHRVEAKKSEAPANLPFG